MAEDIIIENRRLKRFIVNVKVFDLETGAHLGYSANMHTEGMMLTSVEEIPLAREYKLKLEYMSPNDEIIQIPLRAESLWCRPGSNPDFYTSGFRFPNPAIEQTRSIELLIQELGVKS